MGGCTTTLASDCKSPYPEGACVRPSKTTPNGNPLQFLISELSRRGRRHALTLWLAGGRVVDTDPPRPKR